MFQHLADKNIALDLVRVTEAAALTSALQIGRGDKEAVDQDAVNLMRAMGATKVQIFRHLKFPSALNQFFSGLKISASYAVVGAVVAEWLGGFNGLGVYMTRVKKSYAFDKMFAVIIFIVIISLLLMLAVNIIRNLSMPWIRTEKEGKEV